MKSITLLLRNSALILLCAAVALAADDRWISLEKGSITIVTNAGEKAGRLAFNQMEQLRFTLGQTLGKPDAQSLWPIRIVLYKPGKQAIVDPTVKLARDHYVASITELGLQTREDLARIFLESNAGRMPAAIENGIIELFSILEVDGPKVTLGTAPAQKDRDWSRVHMLSVKDAYRGRLRVLIYNLQRGVDEDASYRNAFEKSRSQIEQELDQYILAGNYETVRLSGEPLDPRRELLAKPADATFVAIAEADVLAAHGDPGAKAAYEKLKPKPEAFEGLGDYEAAIKAGSESARAWLEFGRQDRDALARKAELAKAAELNPRWAEPNIVLAEHEAFPLQRVQLLKTAAQLAPRESSVWRLLAEAQEDADLYVDAGKSWGDAERAAATPQERDKMHQQRIAEDNRRLDATKKAKDDGKRKQADDLKDLQDRALRDIRAFEAKANAGQAPRDPNEKLDYYKEGPELPKTSGMLTRVDCQGLKAKLYIDTADGKKVTFMVNDPKNLIIGKSGNLSLDCGPQNPPRRVVIEHTDKREVKTIEFH
jgi:hypothetical protein